MASDGHPYMNYVGSASPGDWLSVMPLSSYCDSDKNPPYLFVVTKHFSGPVMMGVILWVKIGVQK